MPNIKNIVFHANDVSYCIDSLSNVTINKNYNSTNTSTNTTACDAEILKYDNTNNTVTINVVDHDTCDVLFSKVISDMTDPQLIHSGVENNLNFIDYKFSTLPTSTTTVNDILNDVFDVDTDIELDLNYGNTIGVCLQAI